MAEELGSIYYTDIKHFNFDEACTCLKKEGISLLNKQYDGNIVALDNEGEDYEISYEQTKEKALSGEMFNVKIWLDYKWRVIWTFRLCDDCFVFDFHLFSLLDTERNKVSKIFFNFFQHEISSKPQSLLGMFIDKNGQTYDYDFSPVFFTDSEEVDYVTDLICLPKEKFGLVAMESNFGMKELDNGFICASRYPEFLDYLLS